MDDKNMFKSSFAPIVPAGATTLILGSLPGDLSLLQQQYYAHPQNRFWRILYALADQPYQQDYACRLALLAQQRWALWDVCAQAQRIGSMDSAIQAVQHNAIPELLAQQTTITTVCFNGQKAQKLYLQQFEKIPTIAYFCLPSSSPANASYDLATLIQQWQPIESGKDKLFSI